MIIVTQQHGGSIVVDSEVGEFTEFHRPLFRAGSPRRQTHGAQIEAEDPGVAGALLIVGLVSLWGRRRARPPTRMRRSRKSLAQMLRSARHRHFRQPGKDRRPPRSATRGLTGPRRPRSGDPEIQGDDRGRSSLDRSEEPAGHTPAGHYGCDRRGDGRENQAQINAKGTGFKGFIPAVFARLVDEAFAPTGAEGRGGKSRSPRRSTSCATARARPDAWEADVISTKLLAGRLAEGSALLDDGAGQNGQPFRIMVPGILRGILPQPATARPKGEMDKTGYPKRRRQGGRLLGAVISITPLSLTA